MVGADLGDFVLELVEDLDLEGPGVGGKSGLGVPRRLGGLLTLVFLGVLLVNLVHDFKLLVFLISLESA